jgi:hypothetical protein
MRIVVEIERKLFHSGLSWVQMRELVMVMITYTAPARMHSSRVAGEVRHEETKL